MVKILNDDNFASNVEKGLVLVDFFAEWCGPCRMLTPIIEELANEISGVSIFKVNIDESPETAQKYEVSSIPTLVLLKDGKEAKKTVGLKDKDFLLAMIQEHL